MAFHAIRRHAIKRIHVSSGMDRHWYYVLLPSFLLLLLFRQITLFFFFSSQKIFTATGHVMRLYFEVILLSERGDATPWCPPLWGLFFSSSSWRYDIFLLSSFFIMFCIRSLFFLFLSQFHDIHYMFPSFSAAFMTTMFLLLPPIAFTLALHV